MTPMSHATRRPRKTVEDYLALPDDVRAELIDGELYVTAAPSLLLKTAIQNLYLLLANHLRKRDIGHIHLSPLDVHLPSGEVVQPDLIYVSKANDAIRQDWIRGVPDLLIEVVSPIHPERDRIVKRDVYARNGVPVYWLVHLEDRAIEVLRLEAGRYRPEAYSTEDQILTTPEIPGLGVPLPEVFR